MNAPCPASLRKLIREFITAAPPGRFPREVPGKLPRLVRREAAPNAPALRERKGIADMPTTLLAGLPLQIDSILSNALFFAFRLYLSRNDLVFGFCILRI